MRGLRGHGYLKPVSLIMLAMISLADAALAQTVSSSLPLAPGDIITGPVFRRNGTSVPSISSGADANTYLNLGPPTESFTPSAPAVVIRTAVPTQYVRVFTAGVTNPVGGFIAGSNAVRGLNAAQIRDVLALPNLPDSITIVQIPASTCMIVGQAASILGNFAGQPASVFSQHRTHMGYGQRNSGSSDRRDDQRRLRRCAVRSRGELRHSATHRCIGFVISAACRRRQRLRGGRGT